MNAMATQARIDIYGTLRRIFEDVRLSKPAAHLLIGLISYAYGKPVVWPSNQTLAKAARVSERQLRRLLTELRSLGWISERHNAPPSIRPITIQFSWRHDCQVFHESMNGDGRPASGPVMRGEAKGRTSSVRGEDMGRPGEGVGCPTKVGKVGQRADILCPGEDTGCPLPDTECPGEDIGCPAEDAQCPGDIRQPSENMMDQVKVGKDGQRADIGCPGGGHPVSPRIN